MKTLRSLVALLFILVSMVPGYALAQDAEISANQPELRHEILKMLDDAEALRDSLDRAYGYGQPMAPADSARLESQTAQHVERLSDIIREHGWPGNSMVGEEGSQAAWLIAQHADGHLEFQRAVLAFIEEAVDEGEASPRDMAYLKDRVRIAEGRDQVYGTQVRLVDGVPHPFPIEDRDSVDERREEVGLQPLAEYLEELRSMQ